jgi:hypothetical protein
MKWVRENLAIPLGLVALSAIATAGYMNTEIGARQYETLGNMYTQGTNRFRIDLESSASKGSISNWGYASLTRDYWKDASSLSLPIDSEKMANDRTARDKMMRLVKSKIRKPN